MTDQEISRIIAEKVMGWTLEHGWWKDDNGYTAYEAHSDGTLEECDGDWWHPSTDIGQAFQVQDAIINNKTPIDPQDYFAALCKILEKEVGGDIVKFWWLFGLAITHATPLQRCKAALKAMEA